MNNRNELLTELEQTLQAARNYVVPSDNHRPATIEAAQKVIANKRTERMLGGSLLIGSLFMGVIILWVQTAPPSTTSDISTPSKQIEAKAEQYVRERHYGYSQGVADAYVESQAERAKQMGQMSAASEE